MTVSPPLRFLVLVLGGWVGVRAALLGSAWLQDTPPTAAAPPTLPAFARVTAPPIPVAPVAVAASASAAEWQERPTIPTVPAAAAFMGKAPMYAALDPPLQVSALLPAVIPAIEAQPLSADPPLLEKVAKGTSRWSASAWIFGRRGGAAGFAPGGTLGGSQAGARIAYRLNADPARPLAASIRAHAPLGEMPGAETAAGLDWKPAAKLPLHLLVERRQALGKEGRSAFAAMAYGGVSDIGAGPLRIDAYGQAGVVGARSRDLFADGSVRLSLPVAGMKVGTGVWAAAQPGAMRVDVGPQASVRLPGDVTLAVDWRLRVAGEAAPRSGPTITLSTDF